MPTRTILALPALCLALLLGSGCYEIQIESSCNDYCNQADDCGTSEGGLGCEIACEAELEQCTTAELSNRFPAMSDCAAMSCGDFEASCSFETTIACD